MIESSIYYLLKKHFKQEKYYVDLIELFHETTFQTEIGQEQDLIQANEELDLNKHSMTKWVFFCSALALAGKVGTSADNRHHLIVVYKTAFYSFYLPVALAMKMVCLFGQ
jgi:farnesyl diphosphate synthase